ncbi:hypothetical protein ACFC1I_08325 [Microbacterium sp. NPDC056044]|uniref:hypothetical protein n=1 Tax=unclassified Microbacterium TaxID=2609290 RepID=UPI0035D6593F
MTIKNRVLAGVLAVCVASGAGIAAAAPAQAATMTYKSFMVTKSGYTTSTACLAAERSTAWSIKNSGGIVYAGDACGYWGSAKKWGFSITYKKLVPVGS